MGEMFLCCVEEHLKCKEDLKRFRLSRTCGKQKVSEDVQKFRLSAARETRPQTLLK